MPVNSTEITILQYSTACGFIGITRGATKNKTTQMGGFVFGSLIYRNELCSDVQKKLPSDNHFYSSIFSSLTVSEKSSDPKSVTDKI